MPKGDSAGTHQGVRERPLGGPHRAVLAEFLTKLLRLSALRLADLCERLNFAPMDKSDILAQVGHGWSSSRVATCPARAGMHVLPSLAPGSLAQALLHGASIANRQQVWQCAAGFSAMHLFGAEVPLQYT